MGGIKELIMVEVNEFIINFKDILESKPRYELGRDGSDGSCDCIGAIKGALKRAGHDWTGIHGSNYSARFAMRGLNRIVSTEQLSIGEIVYKAKEPNEQGYALPKRYLKGGSMDTGDYLDYYHVGVVVNIKPLMIGHMTTPTAMFENKLGKWGYVGQLKYIDYGVAYIGADKEVNGLGSAGVPEKNDLIIENGDINAMMRNKSGGKLRLRRTPNKNDIVVYEYIPAGAELKVLKRANAEWYKAEYKGSVGYVMSKYVGELGGIGKAEADAVCFESEYSNAEQRIALLEKILDELAVEVESLKNRVGDA